ncbi:hypothetical protein K9857_23465 [Pseudomonas sp. REP124]|uniref:hypothetical protein n=1 Tax=Pseudomonas sp. REP124 TaxID=2875731 RepID=UPI001CCFD5DF|nr:hypothetical protein [Pseudomonas sp. REP124]MBZ9784502.1 hypothetical protein [Pseudomonas sp. REP124]
MNVNLPALSMRSDPYFIKNPDETTNNFTKKNVEDAAETLELKSELSIDELKEMLKGYDFTSISTNELADVGSLLVKSGLIDGDVSMFFIFGNKETDETGHQTGKDVKFNAVAMFNQMLGDRQESELNAIKSFREISSHLTRANHVLAALSYFANSSQTSLSVNVEA